MQFPHQIFGRATCLGIWPMMHSLCSQREANLQRLLPQRLEEKVLKHSLFIVSLNKKTPKTQILKTSCFLCLTCPHSHFPGVSLRSLIFFEYFHLLSFIFLLALNWSFEASNAQKTENLQNLQLRTCSKQNSERHLRERTFTPFKVFSTIIVTFDGTSLQESDLKPSKVVKIFSVENSLFCTLHELLQTHFVWKFRFEALKGYFMVYSTNINFFTTFYRFKNWFGQSSFG